MAQADTTKPRRSSARRRRKIGVAIAVASIMAGVLAASAASLGSLSVRNLGATNSIVAPCQSSGLSLNALGSC